MDSFLKLPTTQKQCEHEFINWHKGILNYGFWAIEVHSPDWLSIIKSAQTHLNKFAFPNYLRAPHITLSACGLIDEHHFSTLQLNRQINALENMSIEPFSLKLGQLNSFTSAMYLSIEDSSHTLNKIRTTLNNITADHPTETYYPHITLGLYRDNFKTKEIANEIEAFRLSVPQNISPIKVNELVFCRYETKVLQGPFEVYRRVRLDN